MAAAAYWGIGFGWLAAGIYFGCCFRFLSACRGSACIVLRLPVILVAPTVYTGLELAQAYLLSGMTMGRLEHTQYRWTTLDPDQRSDRLLRGDVSDDVCRRLPGPDVALRFPRWALWPLAPAVGLLAAVLVYGYFRTAGVETDPGLKMALIQGNIDVQLDGPENIREITDAQYRKLTHDALDDAKFRHVDLIVWPETVFCLVNWVSGDAGAKVPAEFPGSSQEFQARLADASRDSRDVMTAAAREFGVPMLVGVDREHYGVKGRKTFNSAALITPDGHWCDPGRVEQSYYDKMHLVPFGEFMPFAEAVPWLQSISPLGGHDKRRAAQGLPLQERLPGPEHLLRNGLALRDSESVGRFAGAGPGTANPRQRDQRRLVLGLERIGAAFGLRSLSHGRVPAADGDRSQHGHLGLDRCQRPDPER